VTTFVTAVTLSFVSDYELSHRSIPDWKPARQILLITALRESVYSGMCLQTFRMKILLPSSW